jgi:hypothetical protein
LRGKGNIKLGWRCDMFENWNERIKRMTVVDIGLVKMSVFFFTIAIVKFFPQLLKINYAILIALVLACGIKPLCKFWIKK